MSVKSKPVEYLCALDIEALGRVNSSPPFSVGFCHGTCWEDRQKVRITMLPSFPHSYHNNHNKTIDELGINLEDMKLDDAMSFMCENNTWNEFWSKNQNVLSDLMKEALPAKEGYRKLSDTIKQIYSVENSTESKYRVTFLGDNPAYDFSHLNAALETQCDELPIRYSNRLTISEMRQLPRDQAALVSDGYHGIKDPSERIKYHPNAEKIEALVKKYANHSHMPDDDAEGIYLQYLLLKDEKFLIRMQQ